jgi:uncharacterized Zn finger protein
MAAESVIYRCGKCGHLHRRVCRLQPDAVALE